MDMKPVDEVHISEGYRSINRILSILLRKP